MPQYHNDSGPSEPKHSPRFDGHAVALCLLAIGVTRLVRIFEGSIVPEVHVSMALPFAVKFASLLMARVFQFQLPIMLLFLAAAIALVLPRGIGAWKIRCIGNIALIYSSACVYSYVCCVELFVKE